MVPVKGQYAWKYILSSIAQSYRDNCDELLYTSCAVQSTLVVATDNSV